mgnify:CR=1 FL=1
MSVAIEIRKPDGRWVELAEGIQNSRELIDGWVSMAREIYPMAEVRVVGTDPLQSAAGRTH